MKISRKGSTAVLKNRQICQSLCPPHHGREARDNEEEKKHTNTKVVHNNMTEWKLGNRVLSNTHVVVTAQHNQ
jgi:hypothetical protein